MVAAIVPFGFSLEYADNSKKIQIKMVFGMVGQ